MLDETLQPSDESYDVSDVEAFAAAHQSPSDTMGDGDGTAAAPTLSKPGLLVMDVDSTLIDAVIERNDVTVYAVPATKMAGDAGFSTLANMILVGKFLKEVEHCDLEGVAPVLKKVVPPKKLSLLDVNLEAIAAGYNF